MSQAALLKQLKQELVPDKKEERKWQDRVNSIIKDITSVLPEVKAVLGGSGAKGTWLKSFDIDIFVLFPYAKYKDRSAELSDILEKKLKKKFKPMERIHGSRDYFQISKDNVTFEVIPILNITKASQARNITDVSPLHSKWVKKHKGLADEIRLTKQFCKANDLYGAESYIRGFSGYVCEILTIHYGSFQKLLKSAVKWKEHEVIDPEKHYKNKDVFMEMNKSKLVSPLIVVDPVQHDRNAAAALDQEKFDLFRKRAGEFLKKPTRDFFEETHLQKEDLREEHKGRDIILVTVTPLRGKRDVVGSKMMKVYEFLEQKLADHDFRRTESNWHWDGKNDALLYFVFPKEPLPKTKEHAGPPIWAKRHAANFRREHKGVYEKDKRLYAMVEREFTSPEQCIKALLENPYVKERCAKAKAEVL